MRSLHRRGLLIAGMALGTIPWIPSPATAQDAAGYPTKPLRLIVPFGPGSTTDLIGRLAAEKLGQRFGQAVAVENRPGAGGNIGAEAAARAPADGYTLLLGPASTNAINPSLYRHLRFDPIRDFAPVALVASQTNVLVVPAQLPATNVQELIALARQRELTFGSGGAGGSIHLSGELFKYMAGINMVHVPYNGSAAAMPDLLTGRVDTMFDSLMVSLPHIRAGRLRALAVTSARRSPLLPETPIIAEAGLPGYEAEGWYGLFAPAATPKAVLERLYREMRQILSDPAVAEHLLTQGARPGDLFGDQFREFVQAERDKWARVIAAANITLD